MPRPAQDVTQVTLTQIIVDEAKEQPTGLAIDVESFCFLGLLRLRFGPFSLCCSELRQLAAESRRRKRGQQLVVVRIAWAYSRALTFAAVMPSGLKAAVHPAGTQRRGKSAAVCLDEELSPGSRVAGTVTQSRASAWFSSVAR